MKATTYLLEILALTALTLISCTVPADYLQRHTAGNTECSADEVTIIGDPPVSSIGVFSWTASCRGRTYDCNQRMIGERPIYSCQESSSSRARTAVKIAVDRLALQTGCDRGRIRLVEEGDWIAGGERAFRIDACGEPYLCTISPSGTSCDPAAPRQADGAPRPPAGRLSQQEVLGVLSSIEAEVRACVNEGAPERLSFRFQVNGDGTAIYLGTDPAVPAEAAGCIRRLVGELRFRSTDADPFSVTSPPLVFE